MISNEAKNIWKQHFEPKEEQHDAIKVPYEWLNFIIIALLSPDNFD